MTFKYFIGELYQYPNSNKKYRLKKVSNQIFLFECGHWCTDNVFIDLVRVKTNIQVFKTISNQLNLFQ